MNIQAYYDYRDELNVQDQLKFKGEMLVIPVALRREMMSIAHSLHIGIEGCIRQVQDCNAVLASNEPRSKGIYFQM